MPFKYNLSRQHHFKKHITHTQNWKNYNRSLKKRGDITIWLSPDVIDQWYEKNRIYNGTGTSFLYSDMAILTVSRSKRR